MNPQDVIQIGPVALALDRLVALVLIAGFIAAIDRIVQHWRIRAWHPAVLAVIGGLVSARIGHVWQYRESYALDPAAVLQAWLGGWHWVAGVAGAALVLVASLRRQRAVMAALLVLGQLSGLWAIFLAIGQDRPMIRLPQGVALEQVPAGVATLPAGQPLVINLWATWCPPCRRELPMLASAAASERRAAIVLVDQGEDGAAVAAFLRRQQLDPLHVMLDPSGQLGAWAGAKALPTTLFVDAGGNVRQVHMGEITRVQLDIGIRTISDTDRHHP